MIFLGNEEYEEEFSQSLSSLDVKIKCPKGHVSDQIIEYGGIVESSERAMGKELKHVWKNDFSCPTCDENFHIELAVWEYPEKMLNHANFENSDCEILNKNQISFKIGVDIE